MTDTSTPDARPRSALPLLMAVLALIVAGCALWVSYGNSTKAAAPQEQAAVTPAVEQMKQTLSALQRSVEGIQSDQQKLAAQLSDIQQKASAQQGERKLLSDQLGSLSARVNSLESARAESSTATPQAAPDTQKARRTKR
ncbi:septal ring factor EnvC (AmiA/AmiB activator) [Bradyrhizobium sp. GM5.1]